MVGTGRVRSYATVAREPDPGPFPSLPPQTQCLNRAMSIQTALTTEFPELSHLTYILHR